MIVFKSGKFKINMKTIERIMILQTANLKKMILKKMIKTKIKNPKMKKK